MKEIFRKIKRKWKKILLHPIHVFVVHNVSASYSSFQGPKEDWISVNDFQQSIIKLQRIYTFISLEEALEHLKHDVIRLKDFAVLTADDGYHSVYEQLPWLINNNVPITLFINPKYLDGKSYSEHIWRFVHNAHPEISEAVFVKDRYMSVSELHSIVSPLVSIGSHGYEHIDNAQMNDEEFNADIDKTFDEINLSHSVIPFHAYPFGKYSAGNEKVLKEKEICPLLADGWYNINDATKIHREYLPKI